MAVPSPKCSKATLLPATPDITAAKAAQANIAEEFAKYGIKPESLGTATAPSAPASPTAAGCMRAETHWKSAKEIRTLAMYEDTLHAFPPVISPRSQGRASRR